MRGGENDQSDLKVKTETNVKDKILRRQITGRYVASLPLVQIALTDRFYVFLEHYLDQDQIEKGFVKGDLLILIYKYVRQRLYGWRELLKILSLSLLRGGV